MCKDGMGMKDYLELYVAGRTTPNQIDLIVFTPEKKQSKIEKGVTSHDSRNND